MRLTGPERVSKKSDSMRSPSLFHTPYLPAALFLLALAGCGDDADDGSDAATGDPDSGPAVAAFEAPEPAGCIDEVGAGKHTFMCGELTFEVTVPAQCLKEACGVILDVHGWFMHGVMERDETELDRLGEENGYLAIHPTATLQPGMLSAEPEHSWRSGVDDAPLHDFLVDFIDVFNADEDRIHVTGFSQGGAMTWRLIAAYPGLFASAAPAAAATGNLGGGTGAAVGSDADKALPLLFLHGTTDALSPHTVAMSQRDTYVAGWGLGAEEEVESGDGYTWSRFSNDDGLVFEFLQHDYASVLPFLKGHCFPGSTTGGILACKQEEPPFHWGELVMQFFKDHPKGE
jgi:dienelactone hydrolase